MVWKASLQPRKEGELGHGGTACVSSIQDAGQGGCEFQVSLSYIVGPCLTQTESSTPKQNQNAMSLFIRLTDPIYHKKSGSSQQHLLPPTAPGEVTTASCTPFLHLVPLLCAVAARFQLLFSSLSPCPGCSSCLLAFLQSLLWLPRL